MVSPKWLFTKNSGPLFWSAPALGVGIAILLCSIGLPPPEAMCAGVTVLCAIWWILESVHPGVVGLIPCVLFPILGVLPANEVSRSYGHSMILLMLGGFLISVAMERSGAHRRLALLMIRMVGGRGGRRLVFGFMLATAALSMWISNTAACLMMLPVATAVLKPMDDARLRVSLLLAIAYSASIGGMATPIGTLPNVLMVAYTSEHFASTVDFLQWMRMALPMVMVLLPLTWIWLTRNLTNQQQLQLPAVGQWSALEIRVVLVLILTALAWTFRTAPHGGWSAWLPGAGLADKNPVDDATVALAAVLLLFLIPAGQGVRGQRLLDWETAAKIPWGILLMFGGGLALARGFETTGLSQRIGGQLEFVAEQPLWLTTLLICLMVSLLTEMTSSTATMNILLPILGALAVTTGIPHQSILFPATIAASCAFILPVATPPNTIVFSAGQLSTADMAKNGVILNMLAVTIITFLCRLVL